MTVQLLSKASNMTRKPALTKPFSCRYCNTGFTKESTLTVHVCEQKRRALAKTEKHVQLGYLTYVRFFQLTQQAKTIKTYEDFAKSQYYNAFVKFGSFLSNVDPLYLDRYIDYIVTSGTKLDHWCREELYYKYVLQLLKKEPADTAIERSIDTMVNWAAANNSQWNHYFKYVNPNRGVYDIKDGKISPWVILNCSTGREMVSNLNEEQLGIVYETLDPEFWSSRFKKYPADLELIRTVVKEGNL